MNWNLDDKLVSLFFFFFANQRNRKYTPPSEPQQKLFYSVSRLEELQIVDLLTNPERR